ncbi:MFS general substrate transporter [Aureobasidium subglaciale]|nr:MFS general substrate transporter [Aureobasidium subglaciale]
MIIVWPFSVLLVVAMMLTSICTEFYRFLLCQGMLLGVSSGSIFAPAMSVVGHYFLKKRALAMSIASTGSPLGGIIYPVILNNLIPSIGFGWAQRVCGFLTLFFLLVAATTLRPSGMKRQGRLILLEAFKKPAYSFQIAALFMVVFGLWTPYFYLADYSLANGMSSKLAGYLFVFLNTGSLVGRIAGGFLANHLGQFNVITTACYCSAILLFSWLGITSTGGLIVLALLFGASSGIIIALMMSTIAHMADHPSKIGTYIHQSCCIVGFTGLAGTPITGALFDKGTDYSRGIIFSAAVMMVGAVLTSVARYTFAKDKVVA